MKKTSLTLALSLVAGTAAAGPLNFVDVTSTRVVETVVENFAEKHVTFGDMDNDGDMDILVGLAFSDFGERTNELYRNDNGVFQEVSGTSIIPGFNTADVTRSAFFVDVDGDGWLDIHIVCDSNSGMNQGNDKIYINQHPGGVFTGFIDETSSRLPNNGMLGASCSSEIADYDNDGDIDIYLANYPNSSQDRLLFNDGNGVYTDVTSGRIAIPGDYDVDAEGADVNNDGRIDIIITNSHSSDGAYIQYNNNNNGAGRDGDFSYSGSTTSLGVTTEENAIEAGDLDGDGDLDLYWSNGIPSLRDVILENTGLNGNNKVVWESRDILPPSVSGTTSRKAEIVDLNHDGRVDIFVMKETAGNGRPTVLRNTSYNGEMSFVDWTPATAFPNGSDMEGWHAAVFNADDDSDMEIFIGSHNGDHLIDQIPPTTFDEDNLGGGVVPGVFNGPATMVEGTGLSGDIDVFRIQGLSNAMVSVVLSSPGDCKLEIRDINNNLLASSDRGGLNVEEALQVNGRTGELLIRVISQQSGADIDGNGTVDADDFFDYLDLFASDDPGADLTGNGTIDADDFFRYLDLFVGGLNSPYQLEMVARN